MVERETSDSFVTTFKLKHKSGEPDKDLIVTYHKPKDGDDPEFDDLPRDL